MSTAAGPGWKRTTLPRQLIGPGSHDERLRLFAEKNTGLGLAAGAGAKMIAIIAQIVCGLLAEDTT